MAETNQTSVLAIDDSELIHRLLRLRLQHEPYTLHNANSSSEGLRLAAKLRPDIILLDIDMPDMDGFELITKLKNDPKTSEIAVVFVGGANDAVDRVRGLDAGAIDFISKPFDIIELKARLRSVAKSQRMIQLLRDQAQIDAHSGLFNRAHFDQRLKGEVAEATRHDRPLTLVLADIDNFKKANDGFGHLFGDFVIERFASIINRRRASDVACRVGGEEFGIILPQTNQQSVLELLENYRKQFEQMEWQEHPGLSLTASFGVCDLESCRASPPAPLTSTILFKGADDALYRAKQSGRNRVVLYEKKNNLVVV